MRLGRTAAAMLGVLMGVACLTPASFAEEPCDSAVTTVWNAVSDACGCDVASGDKWRRDRADYVNCVREFAITSVARGTLPASCRASLLRAARNSTCSRPREAVPCCRTGWTGATQCKIVNDPSKCESTGSRRAEFGTTELCLDACADASPPACSGNAQCSDGNPCTIDICNAESGCSHLDDPSCNPQPTPTPGPTPPPGGTECSGTGSVTWGLSQQEQTLLQLINQYRLSRGKPGLARCRSLDRAAQDHANDMRDRNYFAHKSKDGTEFWERACEAGFLSGCGSLPQTWMGEIIAGNAPDAAAAMWQWENSAGHAAIMADSAYAALGIGHSCGGAMLSYWVVDFAGRTEASCN